MFDAQKANSVLMSLSKVAEEECPKRSVPHEITSCSYSDVTNDASSAKTFIFFFYLVCLLILLKKYEKHNKIK